GRETLLGHGGFGECGLCHVFCQVGIAGHAIARAPDQIDVTIDELRKGRLVAVFRIRSEQLCVVTHTPFPLSTRPLRFPTEFPCNFNATFRVLGPTQDQPCTYLLAQTRRSTVPYRRSRCATGLPRAGPTGKPAPEPKWAATGNRFWIFRNLPAGWPGSSLPRP